MPTRYKVGSSITRGHMLCSCKCTSSTHRTERLCGDTTAKHATYATALLQTSGLHRSLPCGARRTCMSVTHPHALFLRPHTNATQPIGRWVTHVVVYVGRVGLGMYTATRLAASLSACINCIPSFVFDSPYCLSLRPERKSKHGEKGWTACAYSDACPLASAQTCEARSRSRP